MKTIIISLVLLGFFAFTCYSQSGFCTPDGDSRCAAQGNLCCRDLFLLDTCYNPTTHTCTVIEATAAQRRLCGINDGSCSDVIVGKVCYSKATHHCVLVQNGPSAIAARICALTDQACGVNSICYNTAQYTCVNGQLIPK